VIPRGTYEEGTPRKKRGRGEKGEISSRGEDVFDPLMGGSKELNSSGRRGIPWGVGKVRTTGKKRSNTWEQNYGRKSLNPRRMGVASSWGDCFFPAWQEKALYAERGRKLGKKRLLLLLLRAMIQGDYCRRGARPSRAQHLGDIGASFVGVDRKRGGAERKPAYFVSRGGVLGSSSAECPSRSVFAGGRGKSNRRGKGGGVRGPTQNRRGGGCVIQPTRNDSLLIRGEERYDGYHGKQEKRFDQYLGKEKEQMAPSLWGRKDV